MDEHLLTIVELDRKFYYVSSNYTSDHGFETMIFPCNAMGTVTSWSELYSDIYPDFSTMKQAHQIICADLKTHLLPYLQ